MGFEHTLDSFRKMGHEHTLKTKVSLHILTSNFLGGLLLFLCLWKPRILFCEPCIKVFTNLCTKLFIPKFDIFELFTAIWAAFKHPEEPKIVKNTPNPKVLFILRPNLTFLSLLTSFKMAKMRYLSCI